ncbi:MAG: hypothetical protein ACN6OU_05810 [Stenotrophomonas acidaminiphila]
MRWIIRVFASAIIRRLAAFVFVVVIALLGMGKSFASPVDEQYAKPISASRCTDSNRCPRPEAFSLINAWSSFCGNTYPGFSGEIVEGVWENSSSRHYYVKLKCSKQGSSSFIFVLYTAWAGECPQGEVWNGKAGQCQQPCTGRPSSTTPFLPVSGSTACYNGCTVVYAQNADETSTRSYTGAMCGNEEFKKNCPSGSYYNGYMGVCEPVDKPCPPEQKKVDGQCVPDGKCPEGMIAVPGTTPGAIQQGSLYCQPANNECPPGNVKSPSGQCLPGDGQCAAGEAKGKDGTCKRDSDGDGTPDSEEGPDDPNKDSASGGDSCNAPPSCSGNAISCIQVKIQWRIDCNTRKNRNITGGTCAAMPICTGDKCDAMEYSSLLQQWKAACALEKLAKNGTGTPGDGEGCGAGDANCNGVADVLEGSGEASDPGDGTADVDGAKKWGIGVSAGMLDQGNIFGGGSCPQPPSFQLMGETISGADFPHWCKAMAILRGLILVFGAFTALKILMGGVG